MNLCEDHKVMKSHDEESPQGLSEEPTNSFLRHFTPFYMWFIHTTTLKTHNLNAQVE